MGRRKGVYGGEEEMGAWVKDEGQWERDRTYGVDEEVHIVTSAL